VLATSLDDRPTMSSLLPRGMFIGTSLILRQGAQFLYGARPTRREGSLALVELTGIGGSLEAEDESVTAGLLREVHEEIGCPVKLGACEETLVVRGPEQVECVRLQGDERPAAIVFRGHRTPPHQPWHKTHQGMGCVAVFFGELAGQPWPSMELPALVWLTPEQVVQTAREDVRLSILLEAGAQLIEIRAGIISKRVWVRLTDSQEALVLALGDRSLPYYRDMLRA